MKFKTAVILCGGKGTRLSSVSHGRQKCILEVNGKPFLTYILDWIEAHKIFTRVFLATGHGSSEVQDFFGHSYKDIDLIYSNEEKPLGTGGAVEYLLQRFSLSEKFYLVNGDTFSPFNLQLLENPFVHRGCLAVLHSVLLDDSTRYGSLEISKSGEVLSFKEKSPQQSSKLTKINAGSYLLDQCIFQNLSLKLIFVDIG